MYVRAHPAMEHQDGNESPWPPAAWELSPGAAGAMASHQDVGVSMGDVERKDDDGSLAMVGLEVQYMHSLLGYPPHARSEMAALTPSSPSVGDTYSPTSGASPAPENMFDEIDTSTMVPCPQSMHDINFGDNGFMPFPPLMPTNHNNNNTISSNNNPNASNTNAATTCMTTGQLLPAAPPINLIPDHSLHVALDGQFGDHVQPVGYSPVQRRGSRQGQAQGHGPGRGHARTQSGSVHLSPTSPVGSLAESLGLASPGEEPKKKRKRTSTPREYKCDHPGCDVSFTSSRRDIERHKASVHGPPAKLPCGDTLSFRPDNIKRHRNKCEVCREHYERFLLETGSDGNLRPGRKRKASA